MKTSPVMLVGIIVVLVLIVGAGSYYFLNQSEKISNLQYKTLASTTAQSVGTTSNQEGTEPRVPVITIPVGWKSTLTNLDSTGGTIGYESPEDNNGDYDPAANIEIDIDPLTTDTSPENRVSAIENADVGMLSQYERRAVTISGVPGIEIEYDSNDEDTQQANGTPGATPGHAEALFFASNGYSYKISSAYYKTSAGEKYANAIQAAYASVRLP